MWQGIQITSQGLSEKMPLTRQPLKKRWRRGIVAAGIGAAIATNAFLSLGEQNNQRHIMRPQAVVRVAHATQPKAVEVERRLTPLDRLKAKGAQKILTAKLEKVAQTISAQQMRQITVEMVERYGKPGKRLLPTDPDFKKLFTITHPKIAWYGRAVNDLRLRKCVPELAIAVEDLAEKYYKKYGEGLPIGHGWDYTGHGKGSAHYYGGAIDLDPGPNIGTTAYKKWGKERFRWIADYVSENYSHIRIIFGDSFGISTIMQDKAHSNHMHFDIKPRVKK